MRIALCQIDTLVGDLRGNAEKILTWYARAVDRGADLVAFPELSLCGYPPRDLLTLPDFLAALASTRDELAAAAGETGLIFGTPLPNRSPQGKHLRNGAVLCVAGEVTHAVYKKLLPVYDVFDEARHFEADDARATPITFRGLRLGLHICEDAWNEAGFWSRRLYDRDPVEELARGGAEVMLNISASPFHGRKGPLRQAMFRSHVRRHGHPFLYTNLIGGNDELIFDGQAYAFDHTGTLRARGVPFEEEMLLVEVRDGDIGGAESWRPATSGVPVGFTPAKGGEDERREDGADPTRRDLEEIDAIHRALVLGLRDYASKCGFERALLGLSGGIDSALTAALAVDALGPEAVWGIALPSRYSSRGSLEDAESLATALGIRYDVLSIEPLFSGALEALGDVFAGTDPGLAEENLQARARGNLLMALSNKFGHLLLTTGNKSEVATGYCTLYGDMAGGLAVISDLPKTTVYELARWINRNGIVIPESTLTKPPSAELRPNQKDEDSLPPYDLLDPILEGYIERALGEEDLVAEGFPRGVVRRAIALVGKAEYKRRQAPPGLRISPKAFGSGRRMPIATAWPRHSG